MGDKSGIEWTDATFNPWWGCTKVSPACDHCYAERDSRRFGQPWGQGTPRRYFGEKHWNDPLRWNRKAEKNGVPLKVFCASMGDVFDNEVAHEHRERLWSLIKATPWLRWQLLTKRIGNAASMLPADWGKGYANVWLGITVINQEEADRDVPKLLQTPSAIRFLSCEPLLGSIDLSCIEWLRENASDYFNALISKRPPFDDIGLNGATVDWVIAGGESGPHARPSHPNWFRSLRDQCKAAGVPFFFKQWGEYHPCSTEVHSDERGREVYPDEEDVLDRMMERESKNKTSHRYEIIELHGRQFMRAGKIAGRLLDGRTWDEYPNA